VHIGVHKEELYFLGDPVLNPSSGKRAKSSLANRTVIVFARVQGAGSRVLHIKNFFVLQKKKKSVQYCSKELKLLS
jgi:hypothetical protein